MPRPHRALSSQARRSDAIATLKCGIPFMRASLASHAAGRGSRTDQNDTSAALGRASMLRDKELGDYNVRKWTGTLLGDRPCIQSVDVTPWASVHTPTVAWAGVVTIADCSLSGSEQHVQPQGPFTGAWM